MNLKNSDFLLRVYICVSGNSKKSGDFSLRKTNYCSIHVNLELFYVRS